MKVVWVESKWSLCAMLSAKKSYFLPLLEPVIYIDAVSFVVKENGTARFDQICIKMCLKALCYE